MTTRCSTAGSARARRSTRSKKRLRAPARRAGRRAERNGQVLAVDGSKTVTKTTDLSQLNVRWALLDPIGAVVDAGAAKATGRAAFERHRHRRAQNQTANRPDFGSWRSNSPLGFELDRQRVSVGEVREPRISTGNCSRARWQLQETATQFRVSRRRYGLDV